MPNRWKPNVTVAAIIEQGGRFLLVEEQTRDGLRLNNPAGHLDPGESLLEAAVRETLEETGYEVVVETLTGTYTNPGHVMAYDDGEVRQQFSLAFRCRLIGGQARTSSESKAVRWVTLEEIEGLPLHPSMRLRISDALASNDRPVLR